MVGHPLPDKGGGDLKALAGPDDLVGHQLAEVQQAKGRDGLLVQGAAVDDAQVGALLQCLDDHHRVITDDDT